MDTLRTHALRSIRKELDGRREVSVGVVTSYNPTAHTARVTLQPEGADTGDLHICTPWLGLRGELTPGMSCLVGWDKGAPVAIIGAWYDDARPAPTAPFVFPDACHFLGTTTFYGQMTPPVVTTLPDAGSQWAHAVLAQNATSSVDGGLYYCQPLANGSYAWRAVGTSVATGTATVNAGMSVTVTHGLDVAPTDVQLTPQGNPGGAYWVSNVTSTQLTINLAVSGTVSFYWRASVGV